MAEFYTPSPTGSRERSCSGRHCYQDHTDSLLEKTNGGASHETIWSAWWLEMLSSLLALGCIISIAIILFLYDEKPLPDWPALISVNSLTAIFTAVFKAALIMPIAEGLGQLKWNWFQQKHKLSDVVVFDDASRGPWGSLVLIAKQLPRRRRAYLAVFGSLITLAALAVDPVSQAMIEHRGCQLTRPSSAPELAEISRTNNYTAIKASYPEFSEWAVDPFMEEAMHKGLMDPEETESQVKFECATEGSPSHLSLRTASGNVSSTQTCVYVHWGWISYPVALLVSQWMFSILVMASQRGRVRNGKDAHSSAAWKSSPLALLFYGLSDNRRKGYGGFKTLGDMDRAAKKMDVQLAPVDESRNKGWRFF
ncbi:hypothetical protein CkaCkLH20_06025 [Colletotrichum karsti]|uniref:Uncharacterized protein n=1 Tax=Colletotrichum karsti TaxID=1095194 RepID=A0A9P6LLI4_9PEZI|nr:uncharacterized protein CkaCkLH20_06025 [Colletotrichum karsti]KAF9876617.1 hypothetical protein CkaCkLH20_06025 [Colletotrichum karsti]